MKNNHIKLLVLALPILTMGLLIGLNTYNKTTGDLYRIPITGYDPRDILRGHYLTFRYDWNWKNPKIANCKGTKCTLCLTPESANNNYNPSAFIISRDANLKECTNHINGMSYGASSFEIGSKKAYNLRRYYIPEQYAYDLDSALRGRNRDEQKHKFDIGLRVNKNGQAFIERMYIDGQPLEEWVKTRAPSGRKGRW